MWPDGARCENWARQRLFLTCAIELDISLVCLIIADNMVWVSKKKWKPNLFIHATVPRHLSGCIIGEKWAALLLFDT